MSVERCRFAPKSLGVWLHKNVAVDGEDSTARIVDLHFDDLVSIRPQFVEEELFLKNGFVIVVILLFDNPVTNFSGSTK